MQRFIAQCAATGRMHPKWRASSHFGRCFSPFQASYKLIACYHVWVSNQYTTKPSNSANSAMPSDASSSDTQHPSSPSAHPAWTSTWQSFLQLLHTQGHFVSDPNITIDTVTQDSGALKRAVLSFGRSQPTLLHLLPPSKLHRLINAGLPEQASRKMRNAHKRLTATIIDGNDLLPSDGGSADTSDALRLLLAVDISEAGDPYNNKGVGENPPIDLIPAAIDILPDVTRIAQQHPPELDDYGRIVSSVKPGQMRPGCKNPDGTSNNNNNSNGGVRRKKEDRLREEEEGGGGQQWRRRDDEYSGGGRGRFDRGAPRAGGLSSNNSNSSYGGGGRWSEGGGEQQRGGGGGRWSEGARGRGGGGFRGGGGRGGGGGGGRGRERSSFRRPDNDTNNGGGNSGNSDQSPASVDSWW